MSDVVENGPSRGAWPVEPGESHDEFFELCALSTTGLLSAPERRRLEEHLRHCLACREVHAQYQAMVDAGIPGAVLGGEGNQAQQPLSEWSVEAVEAKLFAQLDREEQATQSAEGPVPTLPSISDSVPSRSPHREPVDALWRQMWWQYAAGVMLVFSLGVALYRTGLTRGERIGTSASPAHRAPAPVPDKLNAGEANPSSADRPPGRSKAEVAEASALRAQVKSKTDRVAQLEDEKARLEQRLLAIQHERDQLAGSADQMGRKLEATQTELAAVHQQLELATAQDSDDAARLAGLEQQIEDLRTNAGRKDREIAREQELLEHDRDIRELMGSRKLYIAEVYDVAKDGQTQRPFGRVFYTKGKSLIFYAYDLDQQPGIHEASSFQAWGRKGPDANHAVNLGIFYADNAANKRWVLKSEDPKVLADIDAVFVTVEPHGGSHHPSGKPLLFAYLRMEPNHP
jgi:hypothetical protein